LFDYAYLAKNFISVIFDFVLDYTAKKLRCLLIRKKINPVIVDNLLDNFQGDCTVKNYDDEHSDLDHF
jgi:hypothetical protein